MHTGLDLERIRDRPRRIDIFQYIVITNGTIAFAGQHTPRHRTESDPFVRGVDYHRDAVRRLVDEQHHVIFVDEYVALPDRVDPARADVDSLDLVCDLLEFSRYIGIVIVQCVLVIEAPCPRDKPGTGHTDDAVERNCLVGQTAARSGSIPLRYLVEKIVDIVPAAPLVTYADPVADRVVAEECPVARDACPVLLRHRPVNPGVPVGRQDHLAPRHGRTVDSPAFTRR